VPAFAYRAVDPAGKRLRATADAADAATLGRELAARGLVVLEASPVAATNRRARGVGRHGLLDVTRALASLLPAGMPLARALGSSGSLAAPGMAAVLADVRQRVERGSALHAALAAHAGVFPPVYVGLVRAGERSGTLDAAFQRLAAQLEREEQLRARLLSAAIYPALLAVVGAVAVVVLLLFVLPRFADLLTETGAELPRSTAALLDTAAAARRWWPLGVTTMLIGGLTLGAARRTAGGRRAIAAGLLRVPVLGALRRQLLAARTARLTGTLIGGGAPLLAALDDAAESLADPLVRDETLRVRARVREGVALHRALAEGGLFPALLPQLVAVGEESGDLATFLLKAADLFDERAERTLARLVALLEPAMIVGFGGIVGFVALSLLQAIYGVNAGAFQ